MTTIILENLKTGKVRATGRHDGRTLRYFEGEKSDAKALVETCAVACASQHALPSGGFDSKYVDFNAEARVALLS